MKRALGIVMALLLTPSVACGGDTWDRYWDFSRHLRDISWALEDLNWQVWAQNLPPAEPAIPALPSTKWTKAQQAASSWYSSVKNRQQYKKDRRARTRAKLRDEALDREMRERGIVVID